MAYWAIGLPIKWRRFRARVCDRRRSTLEGNSSLGKMASFHEVFAQEAVAPPSERSTGLVFATVAIIVAVLWSHNMIIFGAALLIAVALVAASLSMPERLRSLNLAWFWVGLALNKVVSPIVMLVLFAVVIVPFGLALQLRADPLRKRRQPDRKSYWIERDKSGPPASMVNQF